MSVHLDPNALANFEKMAGKIPKSKVGTKKRGTTKKGELIVSSGDVSKANTIQFECIHIEATRTSTFTFEATTNIPIDTLKKTLSGPTKIPLRYLQLLYFDVELTFGTLRKCGIEDDCTVFITDSRKAAENEQALENFQHFDQADFVAPPVESRAAAKKGNYHDALLGMDDAPPKRKPRTQKKTAVQQKTAPSNKGVVDEKMVEILQKMSAKQLRDVATKQGLKPVSWNKAALIQQICNGETARQTGEVNSPPPSKPLPQPPVKVATPAKKFTPTPTATTNSSVDMWKYKSMSAKQLRDELKNLGSPAKSWNKQTLLQSLEDRLSSNGGAEPAPVKPESKKVAQPVKAAPVKPKKPSQPVQPVVRSEPVKSKRTPKPVAAPAPTPTPASDGDLKKKSSKQLRELVKELGGKPTTWNKSQLMEQVAGLQGGAATKPVQKAVPVKKVAPVKKRTPPVKQTTPSVRKAAPIPPPKAELAPKLNTKPPPTPEPAELSAQIEPPPIEPTSLHPTMFTEYKNRDPAASVVSEAPSTVETPTPPPMKKPANPPNLPSKAAKPGSILKKKAQKKEPKPEKQNKKKLRGIAATSSMWEQKSVEAKAANERNPFSKDFNKEKATKKVKGQSGMPKRGSKAYERMVKAQAWARKKIVLLYQEIPKCQGAQYDSASDTWSCPFGGIFEHYQHVDCVITGTLKSAKKKGIVSYDNGRPFPLLQQTYDDDTIVYLHPMPEEYKAGEN